MLDYCCGDPKDKPTSPGTLDTVFPGFKSRTCSKLISLLTWLHPPDKVDHMVISFAIVSESRIAIYTPKVQQQFILQSRSKWGRGGREGGLGVIVKDRSKSDCSKVGIASIKMLMSPISQDYPS